MNTVATHSKLPVSDTGNVKLLKEGSSVLVRVIADKGNGKYDGSVAGVRVSLTSKNPLTVGQSFTASVSLKNGMIQVIPKGGNSGNVLISTILQQNPVDKLINSLGIASDSLTEHIACQLKQLKLKFQPDLFLEIKRKASKYSGKEKLAAEIISLLKHKNLDFSDTAVNLLFKLFEDDELNENEQSLLKLINSTDGWVFLPYEIISKDSMKPCGSGVIKLLLFNGMNLKKINLNVNYRNKEYFFVLDFDNRKCKEIRMNVSNCSEARVPYMLELLRSKIDGAVTIEWQEKSLLEGTDCESENFFSIAGEV